MILAGVNKAIALAVYIVFVSSINMIIRHLGFLFGLAALWIEKPPVF